MKKINYAFLLAAALVFFAGCLKEGTAIPGATGATGNTGAPGGGFLTPNTEIALGNSFVGTSPTYYTYWVFSGFNPNITYMLSVYVTRTSTLKKTWYGLPYSNIYTPGDELYATLKYDTVKIVYNSSQPWPDSTMDCEIIVTPQPQ